jgi:hypothetical protein
MKSGTRNLHGDWGTCILMPRISLTLNYFVERQNERGEEKVSHSLTRSLSQSVSQSASQGTRSTSITIGIWTLTMDEQDGEK